MFKAVKASTGSFHSHRIWSREVNLKVLVVSPKEDWQRAGSLRGGASRTREVGDQASIAQRMGQAFRSLGLRT